MRKKSLSKKGNGNKSDVRVHASTYTTKGGNWLWGGGEGDDGVGWRK